MGYFTDQLVKSVADALVEWGCIPAETKAFAIHRTIQSLKEERERMPNWCDNDLYIWGPGRDEIADFIADDKDVIDFNKIIPMPEALRDTTKGSLEWDAKIVNGMSDGSEMLNYAWIKEEGITNLEELKAFLIARNPEIKEYGQKLLELKAQLGFTNWYDWSVQNWGTKWPARGGYRRNGSTYVKLNFATAWGPPKPIIEKLSEMYPKNTFSLQYFEGGNGFKGRFSVKGEKVMKDVQMNYRGARGG